MELVFKMEHFKGSRRVFIIDFHFKNLDLEIALDLCGLLPAQIRFSSFRTISPQSLSFPL